LYRMSGRRANIDARTVAAQNWRGRAVDDEPRAVPKWPEGRQFSPV
jgi:hypothetical protein